MWCSIEHFCFNVMKIPSIHWYHKPYGNLSVSFWKFKRYSVKCRFHHLRWSLREDKFSNAIHHIATAAQTFPAKVVEAEEVAARDHPCSSVHHTVQSRSDNSHHLIPSIFSGRLCLLVIATVIATDCEFSTSQSSYASQCPKRSQNIAAHGKPSWEVKDLHG